MPRLMIALCLLIVVASVSAQTGGSICTLAYEDVNENGVHEADEPVFAGISVNLIQQDLIIGTHITTTSSEAFCFQNLPSGEYSIEFEQTPNHTATTDNRAALTLTEGQRIRLEYGAVPQSPFNENAPASSGEKVESSTRLLISLMAAVLAMIVMIGLGAGMMSLRR